MTPAEDQTDTIASLRCRIHKAQAALERTIAKIEAASHPPDGIDGAVSVAVSRKVVPTWRDWLWGSKESAASAIARLQQMQARWVELEFELLRYQAERAGAEGSEPNPDNLDLDLIEREIDRLRKDRADVAGTKNADPVDIRPFRPDPDAA